MRFKHTNSLMQLTSKALIAGEPMKHLMIKATDFSTYFSIFLANSKGKDKTIALFQYLFQFFCVCAKNSNIEGITEAYRAKQLIDMRIYYGLKESISSARKVFRLFRFFDEIRGLVKVLKTDKPIAFKILSVFTYLCSIMYYISDNTLWVMNIIVKSGGLDKSWAKYWKLKKNTLSLFRVIAYSIILIYSVALQKSDLKDRFKELTKILEQKPKVYQDFDEWQLNQSPTQQDGEHSKFKKQKFFEDKILEARRKQRFLYLELVLSFCRIQMLIQSFKLEGHLWLDPIYVAVLGVCSSLLNFLKAMYEKRIILSIDKKQESSFSIKRLPSKFW